jgi:hypothetical protein
MSLPEKRKFTRVLFRTEVRVKAGDQVVTSTHLRDVSLGGAFVEGISSLKEGEPCLLTIELIGPASLLRVEVEGAVTRSEPNGIGVKFTRIDVDSLLHLHYLIKIHSIDPESVDVEFAKNLLAIRP